MATIFRARRTDELRSGGKLVRGRRVAAAKTPYDRPSLEPSVQENPSWLVSTTRKIASGAGKIISSVFGSDTSSSSSSSSSDSSGGESNSEEEANEDNNHMDSPPPPRAMTKNGTSTETIRSFRKELQLSVAKSETKRLIEELLMQETFSREECDRLIEIVRSRVITWPTDGEYGRLSDLPNRIVDSDAHTPDLRTAVREAKKWLEEKKLGSSLKSQPDHGTCTLNSAMLPHVNEGEVGSPVDLAKSYMRTRPPWASPSLSNELKTPSPTGIHPFTDETPYSTPYSIGHNSVSSSKLKRVSLANGPWNIQEEIRRVRAKATEDMLGNSPSMKIDLSEFRQRGSQNSVVAYKTEVSLGDKIQNLNSVTVPKSMDPSLELATGPIACHGSSVSDATQDGFRNEALSSNPALFVSEQNQEKEGKGGAASNSHHPISPKFASKLHNEDILTSGVELHSAGGVNTVLQSVDGDDGLNDSHGPDQQLNSVMDSTMEDARVNDGNCSTPKEVTLPFPSPEEGTASGGMVPVNGFPSDHSLPPPPEPQHNPGPCDEELNPITPTQDNVVEACELLSEASLDVPIVSETDVSRSSNSLLHAELADDFRKPNSKRSSGRGGAKVGKQQAKKLTRYNRKGVRKV